jgi:hypothetical protein
MARYGVGPTARMQSLSLIIQLSNHDTVAVNAASLPMMM